MDIISQVAFLVLIAGGLNWLAIAVSGEDLVTRVSMGHVELDKGIKIAVGIAALYVLYILYGKKVML